MNQIDPFGWVLLIFMGLLVLFALYIFIRVGLEDSTREKQSKRNLAILHHTGHRPLHTHWDEDGYLVND